MKNKIAQHEQIIDFWTSKFELFEGSLNGSSNLPLHRLRKAALEKFSSLGIPTTRQEEWKHTNVAPIFKHEYALTAESTGIRPEDIASFVFSGFEQNLLVFVNGKFSAALSTFDAPAHGVQALSLAEAVNSGNALVQEHLSRYARFEQEPFVALNTAFMEDGLFVHVPDNTVLQAPLQVLHLADARNGALYITPRNLILLGKNSQARLVESYYSLADAAFFNNSVSEVVLGANARFEQTKVQDASKSSYHVAMTQVWQERDSNFTSFGIDLGSAIVRNNLHVMLNAPGSETHLYGFFLGTGTQLIDNHTLIDHAQPQCESNELYKGILDDRARGVFNGKIMVRRDAQKTNAYQDSKCLLLTNEVEMDAKPQLEIFADDVKCSHGATVGQLDAEALFYLRSRGIALEMANSLLRYAFASDVFEKMSVEAVKNKLEAILFERFVD